MEHNWNNIPGICTIIIVNFHNTLILSVIIHILFPAYHLVHCILLECFEIVSINVWIMWDLILCFVPSQMWIKIFCFSDKNGEWRRFHNEELHSLYRSPTIVRVIKSRRLRWAGHVAKMEEGRSYFNILTVKPTGKVWGDNLTTFKQLAFSEAQFIWRNTDASEF